MFNNPLPKLLKLFPDEAWDQLKLLNNTCFDIRLVETYIDTHPDNQINWGHVVQNPNLTADFIPKYQERIDWKALSRWYNMTREFVEKYHSRLEIKNLFFNLTFIKLDSFVELTEKYFPDFASKIIPAIWVDISFKSRLTRSFIEKYHENLNIEQMLLNPFFTRSEFFVEIIGKYYLPNLAKTFPEFWSVMSAHAHITMPVIELFYDKLVFGSLLENNISLPLLDLFLEKRKPAFWHPLFSHRFHDVFKNDIKKKNIHIHLFEKYDEYLKWDVFSCMSNLPIDFIEKFQHRVNWKSISKKSRFINEIIKKYPTKVDFLLVSQNDYLDFNSIEEYHANLSWRWLSEKSPHLSQLLEKYPARLIWEHVRENENLTWEVIWQNAEKIGPNFEGIFPRHPFRFLKKHPERAAFVFNIFQHNSNSKNNIWTSTRIFDFYYWLITNLRTPADWAAIFPWKRETSKEIEDDIAQILGKVDWHSLSRRKLTLETISAYEKYIVWETLSMNLFIDLEIIQKYSAKISWHWLSKNEFNLHWSINYPNKISYVKKIRTEIFEYQHQKCRQHYNAVLDMLKLRIRDFNEGVRESMI